MLEYLQKTNKKLAFKDYYSIATQLAMHFNPTYKPPKLTREHKQRAKERFLELEKAYNACNFTHRQNIFPFTFNAFKIFEHEGYLEFLPMLSQLKGRDLLLQHESDYAVVARHLGWHVAPIVGNLSVMDHEDPRIVAHGEGVVPVMAE